MNPLRATLSLALATLALAAFATTTHAGANQGATAYLSWSPTALLTDQPCAAINTLYVHVSRSGGISFRGGEIDLTWDPASNGLGCMDHIGTIYKTSTGTTCTYLNRGSVVPVVTADDANHFHVAWATNTLLTSCTQGNIVVVQFESDLCTTCGACFSLNFVLLQDSASLLDTATITSGVVTLGGGGGHNCQLVTPAQPTTWGQVKSLYGS